MDDVFPILALGLTGFLLNLLLEGSLMSLFLRAPGPREPSIRE